MRFLPFAALLFLPVLVPGISAAASRPFSGTPAAIPGNIEAEEFDEGGEGVAWHDTTRGNEHRSRDLVRNEGIRTDSDVDIQPCGEGGLNVGWFRAGEWMAYTVEVKAAGWYSMEFRVASYDKGGIFHVSFDGKDATGPLEVPDTGGYQDWASVFSGGFHLTKGMHAMRVVGDREGPFGIAGNLDSYDILPAKGGGRTAEAGLARAVFRDRRRPVGERVADLVGRMTLYEKVSQMGYVAPAIPRLGIPGYNWWNECVHGVLAKGVTVYPHAIGLAATWNPALVGKVAEAISDEARALHRSGRGGLTYWSPVINMARDPRWGRTQECYGEDPWLTGKLGVAFIRGLQGDNRRYLKLVATPKHYALNNDENRRMAGSSGVDERLLREYYLPQFRECLGPGGARSVMCALNAINGEPCCTSRFLLNDVLREEWGFTGYVVSDSWALNALVTNRHLYPSLDRAAAAALKAGVDLDCGRTFQWNLARAVRRGLVAEAEVDRAMGRLLEARFRLGMFDPPDAVPWNRIPAGVVDSPAFRELARRAARESLVLLKNDRALLPLGRGVRKVAVSGRLAAVVSLGNYSGTPTKAVTPLEGIRKAAGPGIRVTWTATRGGEGQGAAYAARAADDARGADVAVVVAGTDLTAGEEGNDRKDLELPPDEEALIEAVGAANPRTVLVIVSGNPVAIRWATANIPAILEAWYPGEEGGTAIGEALFGAYNPGGKLPITFPRSADDLPPMDDYDIRKGRTYMYPAHEPLFPFGYGLSYTTFALRGLAVNPKKAVPGGKVTVSVEVRNTGKRRGDEVVQLYLTRPSVASPAPVRVLRGAQRVGLAPGESRVVRFTLGREELSSLNSVLKAAVLPGSYLVMAGSSSATGITASFEVGPNRENAK